MPEGTGVSTSTPMTADEMARINEQSRNQISRQLASLEAQKLKVQQEQIGFQRDQLQAQMQQSQARMQLERDLAARKTEDFREYQGFQREQNQLDRTHKTSEREAAQTHDVEFLNAQAKKQIAEENRQKAWIREQAMQGRKWDLEMERMSNEQARREWHNKALLTAAFAEYQSIQEGTPHAISAMIQSSLEQVQEQIAKKNEMAGRFAVLAKGSIEEIINGLGSLTRPAQEGVPGLTGVPFSAEDLLPLTGGDFNKAVRLLRTAENKRGLLDLPSKSPRFMQRMVKKAQDAGRPTTQVGDVQLWIDESGNLDYWAPAKWGTKEGSTPMDEASTVGALLQGLTDEFELAGFDVSGYGEATDAIRNFLISGDRAELAKIKEITLNGGLDAGELGLFVKHALEQVSDARSPEGPEFSGSREKEDALRRLQLEATDNLIKGLSRTYTALLADVPGVEPEVWSQSYAVSLIENLGSTHPDVVKKALENAPPRMREVLERAFKTVRELEGKEKEARETYEKRLDEFGEEVFKGKTSALDQLEALAESFAEPPTP